MALTSALLCASLANAQPINGSPYSFGQSWFDFTTTRIASTNDMFFPELRIRIESQSVDCTRDVRCGSTSFDTVAHLFRRSSRYGSATPGTEVGVFRCTTAGPCTSSGLIAETGDDYSLLIHGGTRTFGTTTGFITVTPVVDGIERAPVVSRLPFRFAGDIMIDLSTRPAGSFDIHSVLVPDGPRFAADGTVLTPGNTGNDYLGLDATEMWIMDASQHMINADLAFTGVGSAAMIPRSQLAPHPGYSPRYALVRSWLPPSFCVRLPGRPDCVQVASAIGGKVAFDATTNTSFIGGGRALVIVNGGFDSDGDGLSNEVEQLLGLCDGVHAYATLPGDTRARSCVRADEIGSASASMDPRDTDGDGITDGAEVLGSDVSRGTPPLPNGAPDTAGTPRPQLDTDQTFPLWGFNPRHRDVLIELDRYQTSTPAPGAMAPSCWNGPMTGCRADGAVYPVIPDSEPPDTQLAGLWSGEQQLWSWHESFAHIAADRANNPDGLPGIELHFDVMLMPTSTGGHGKQPDFLIHTTPGAVMGSAGTIVYVPNGSRSSQCTCDGQFMAPDPRHGGYSHYAFGRSTWGDGNSLCDGRMNFSLLVGARQATHEMGHHLTLQHGGPTNCLNNPFGYDPARRPDIERSDKIPYTSLMGSYGRPVGFSTGERIPWPLPRQVDRADCEPGGLSYPETNSYAYDDLSPYTPTDPVRYFGTARIATGMRNSAGAHVACFGNSGLCSDADFDRNHHWSGCASLFPANADGGGAYQEGRTEWLHVPHYWCGGTHGHPSDDACCNDGSVPLADGTCGPGVGRTRQTLSRTMLLAGQPAATIAFGRLYAFFVDDLENDDNRCDSSSVTPCWNGSQPARRCPLDDSTCRGGTWRPDGLIRWASQNHFTVLMPSDDVPCTGLNETCAPASELARGFVHDTLAMGAIPRVAGTSLLSAATIHPGLVEAVALAWTNRNYMPSGLNCIFDSSDPGRDCAHLWGPAHIRFATSRSQLEGVGGSLGASADSLSFPAGEGQHVDAVAVAAWNPRTGTDDTFFVVAHDAISGNAYWTTCDPLTRSCESLSPSHLLIAGTDTLRVQTTIALATQHATGAHLVVAYGAPGASDPTTPNLRILELTPGAGGFAQRHLNAAHIDGSVHPMVRGSAISAAFTAVRPSGDADGRLLVDFEYPSQGPDTTVVHVIATDPGLPAVGATTIGLDFDDSGYWEYSDQSIGNNVDLTANRETPPGTVPALVFDDRSGVTTGVARSRIAFMEHRVRAVEVAQGYQEILLQLIQVADGRSDVPNPDYDDTQSVAWAICPTIAHSGGGSIGPELPVGSPTLQCPGRDDWPGNQGMYPGALIPHLCGIPCPPRPSPELMATAIRIITAPSARLTPALAFAPLEPVPPPLPSRRLPLCAAGQLSQAYAAQPIYQSLTNVPPPQ